MTNNLYTPTQQKDLETYRTSGELGSLKTILIDDCCKFLDDTGTSPANQQNLTYEGKNNWRIIFGFNRYKSNFFDAENFMKIAVVLTLLSRKEGKANMPFLDVNIGETDFGGEDTTLDHWLYREFTEALRVCKDFETALGIITKTYINEVYKNN